MHKIAMCYAVNESGGDHFFSYLLPSLTVKEFKKESFKENLNNSK